ncbi:TPA: transporter [Legionella anisa]
MYCCIFLNLYAATSPQKSISYSAGLGTPITTSTADTLAKGEIDISQRTEYYPNTLLSDKVLLEHPLAENLKSVLTNYLTVFYGLGNNLTIGASIPYVFNSSISAASFNEKALFGNVTNLGNSYGLGDANFFALWRLIEETKHPFSLALLSGINAPTGKTTAKDNNGILFSTSDQPGSGAWTPFAGIIISKQFKKFSLSSNLIYTQSTEGAQETTLGSVLDYNFATVLELYHNEQTKLQIDGIMEFNGEYIASDNIAGLTDRNSGGHSIFLLPGLRVNINVISCYLGVNVPLLQSYYGTQVKINYGLTGGVDISI